MTDLGNQKSPRAGRWMRVCLAGSLGLNLLVIGLAVGVFLRFDDSHGARRPPPSLTTTLYRTLPREEREALRRALRDAPQSRIQDRRENARELAVALRNTPYDSGAVEHLVFAQLDTRTVWQRAVLNAWMERVAAMSDDARRRYAGRVEEFMKNRPSFPHGRGAHAK
ncbi:periplasmic heavy metal sensor [Rhodobacteraceae bacterium F11138]|nr:periplasmic heavy metal sensor [Rhodobacteraceae bacterium F11138]